ncbi:MAG: hypothetical protein VB135_04835, partial [Burkholderia sp.]
LDWLLGINVNRSLARPIYATTPNNALRCRTAPEIFSSTDRPETGFCSWAWCTLRKHLANDT